MYDFGGRECPHCGKTVQVFRGRFRWHGPRGSRCAGSGEVFEAVEQSVQRIGCTCGAKTQAPGNDYPQAVDCPANPANR